MASNIKYIVCGILLGFIANICFSNIVPVDENEDVIKQIKGDYGDMDRKESLPLGAIQHIWDKTNSKFGIYCVEHKLNEVIKIRIREHMTTTIILPEWESIERVLVGDHGMFNIIQSKDNILALEIANYIGGDTNLTIIGRCNIYWFYVRGEGYNSKTMPDLGVLVKADKPICCGNKRDIKERGNAQKSQTKDYLEKVHVDIKNLNFKYSMAGDQSIAPKLVYSDGIRTWLYYGDKIKKCRLPAVYSLLDGVDVPINVVRIGDHIVTQGSGPFTLKNGNRVTCIYPTKE